MKLAIISYPDLESEDREWIETVRARHDPQARRLGVHFTLVFPAEALPDAVSEEMKSVARMAQPIPFTIRGARAVEDVLGGGGHVCLVPYEGRDRIAALHDQLYQGVLRPHLREDISFTPHMTVAAGPDLAWCEGFAEELGLEHRTVHGVLRRIEIVNVATPRVESIETSILGR